jgi:D-aminoacyl-tRNA deacylase
MIALLQRVSSAQVTVDGQVLGVIAKGLLIFLCAEPDDSEADIDRLLNRLLDYRIFSDDNGKMNLSVRAIGGGVLLIPQFTLAADTRSGLRPGFSNAAPPALGKQRFEYAWSKLQQLHQPVACGCFGADMQVSLTNDGPATFWLRS